MGITGEFDALRKDLNRMLQEAFRERQGAFQEPFIYGFTVRSTPDRRDLPRRVRIETPEERAPEVCAEVVESEDSLYVTLELPRQAGPPRVSAKGRRMLIHGDGGPLSVELPDEVEPEPRSVAWRNGVLDVVWPRLAPRATLRIG